MSYVDLARFKTLSIIRPQDVDQLEAIRPGFTVEQIALYQSKIDSRLRKRYVVPFASPPPNIVVQWLVALVTPEVMRARGVNPSDAQITQIETARALAETEIQQAADSKDGLWDLPLREDKQDTSAVVGAAPMSYSETSPYVWQSAQRSRGTSEDSNGGGSSNG